MIWPKSGRRNPTIGHLLHTLHVGGAEMLARQFAFQAHPNCRAVFFCLDELGTLGLELREAGYPVEVLRRRPGFDLRCVLRLARCLRRFRVDVLHTHQYGPFLYGALARLFARNTPLVFTEHGRDFPDYRRPKRVLANRILLKRHDRVVAVGQWVRRALVQHEGFAPERVDVIRNGVDSRLFTCGRSSRDEIRGQLGVTPDETLVVQVARLNRLKDHPTAIKAMELVRLQDSAVRLAIVGDGEERTALEQMINSRSLGSAVSLLGLRTDISRLLSAADIFLLTSISEGIPLTLLEAMLSRLPSICTSVGGIPEVIIDGETGFLAGASDAYSVAARIAQLARSRETRRAFGEAGYRRAVTLFSAEQMLAEYRALYRELLTPLYPGVYP
jgi:L-malate glycosyltransferase